MIGAGVLGASVAARLAAAGMDVTVLEQDQPGRATSRWSFAWLNSNDKAPRSYHDLNHAGIRAWAELAPELDGAAWYRPVGHVELAASEAGRAELAARVQPPDRMGLPGPLIDAAEAVTIEPALRLSWPQAAAAWFPEEAYVLTEPLIERLIGRARACGATILTGERGRVTGLAPGRVRTADGGQVLAADEIVCCAGRWTTRWPPWPPCRPALPVPLVSLGHPRRHRARPGRPRRPGRPGRPGARDSHAASWPCVPTPAAWCTWRPRTPQLTCIRPRPSSRWAGRAPPPRPRRRPRP